MKLNNWSVVYPDGTQAVRELNLSMERGEHVALIGANGAGKSSLILSLVGILPASGEAEIFGTPVDKAHINEVREKTGVVFQNPDDQLFMPTIFDDVAFGPRNLGLDEETVKHRVEDRLELLHISHLRDKTALKLSGGEKRMAAMATVLAMKPDVMLFDEPTAFLDPKARRALINVLKNIPHTMLIATHDLSFALEVCPRCIILKEGRLFAEGLSEKLLFDVPLMDNAGVEAIPLTPTPTA